MKPLLVSRFSLWFSVIFIIMMDSAAPQCPADRLSSVSESSYHIQPSSRHSAFDRAMYRERPDRHRHQDREKSTAELRTRG
jgi:hypothetical protein